jgi:hypothetical protein
MNIDQKKYLSDVLRKKVKLEIDELTLNSKDILIGIQGDQNTKNFLLDTKYQLRLDEIV